MERPPIALTPEQAGRVTGVSPSTQRDWRKLGLMPPNPGGWARYDLPDLCRLFLLGVFSRSILSPELRSVSPIVDKMTDAMSADVADFLDGETPADLSTAFMWSHLRPRIAVVWADGSLGNYVTIEHAYQNADDHQMLEGPVTIIDTIKLVVPFIRRLRPILKGDA